MTTLPWQQPGWLDDVSRWISAALAGKGLALTGDISQPHVRPWSTVLSVPTDQGTVFCKAVSPAMLHEVRVTLALAQLSPLTMPVILASDLQHGWLLMRDSGARFRERLIADPKIQEWESVLPVYAGLQCAAVPTRNTLLAHGMPDRRPESLAAHYANLLDDTASLRLGEPGGLTAPNHARLRAARGRVTALCAQLAAAPVPSTIHHGDLHDANVLLNAGAPVFIDWGDASMAHPFFSMRAVLVSCEYRFDLPEGAPVFDQLRDAYLEPWTTYAPLTTLRDVYALAHRLSPICSALGWHHALAGLDEAVKREYGHAVPNLLLEALTMLADD